MPRPLAPPPPPITGHLHASAAREAGLLTDRVAEVVAGVRREGGDAAMAMLGDTAFAFGTDLSEAGYDPEACAVHPGGATLREPDR